MDGHVVWARPPAKKQPVPARRRTPSHSRPPFEVLWRGVRDVVLFLFGLGLLYHQAVVVPPGKASEILVGAALALIFGWVPLRLDERRKNGANGS